MNIFSKYDLNKKYLCACSGGPDSMALLDMLRKANFKLIVAHVNYKTRKESDSEEELVKEYCALHHIPCFVSIFPNFYNGSFEDAARVFRYRFFSRLNTIFKTSGLFVAHHKDDLLETYLLKKKRNVINESYLLQEHTFIFNMDVYRPLILSYFKEDLLNYCRLHSLAYGIDVTNFMDITPRNVLRKKIANMDKNALYNKALEDENKLVSTRNEVKNYINDLKVFSCLSLKEKDDYFLLLFLYEIIDKKYKNKAGKSLLLTFKEALNSSKPNLKILLKDNYYLVKEYDNIYFTNLENVSYSYTLNSLEFIKTPYFELKNSGAKMEGICVDEKDFPITIRNASLTDVISLKEGRKKLNRLFIDAKVPLLERNKTPVIVNKNNEIIYVYKLYRKYGLKYVQNNLFMIK